MVAEKKYPYVVYIGRFQPMHKGHYQMMLSALALGQVLILVLGSAKSCISLKNPFSVAQREQMILACFTKEERQRIIIVSQRDTGNNRRWAKAVEEKVLKITGTQEVGIITHIKDQEGVYQTWFNNFEQIPQPNYEGGINATQIRTSLMEDMLNVEAISDNVPLGVYLYLRQWVLSETYAQLNKDHNYYKQCKYYNESIAISGVSFITCSIENIRYILVMERLTHPYIGSFSFPERELDPLESLSCYETAIKLVGDILQDGKIALKGNFITRKILDGPGRFSIGSQTQRSISIAHHIDLGNLKELPKLNPMKNNKGIDEEGSFWVPLRGLAKMETMFCKDGLFGVEKFFEKELCIID